MNESYVLDACALIAMLDYEPGAITVAQLCMDATEGAISLSMNKVNLLEVYYGYRRSKGELYANAVLRCVYESVITITDISTDVLIEAGRIKAGYGRVSLADSIAVAEAACSGGYLVTSDHHELDALEAAGVARFIWIR